MNKELLSLIITSTICPSMKRRLVIVNDNLIDFEYPKSTCNVSCDGISLVKLLDTVLCKLKIYRTCELSTHQEHCSGERHSKSKSEASLLGAINVLTAGEVHFLIEAKICLQILR